MNKFAADHFDSSRSFRDLKNNSVLESGRMPESDIDDGNLVSNNPMYRAKLAELMEKIGNESTTMANLYDGTIIAVKMKTVISTYVWNESKEDFAIQRTKNMRNRKKSHNQDDSDISSSNEAFDEEEMEDAL